MKAFLIANWKMNLLRSDVESYCNQISLIPNYDKVKVVLSPSFIHMDIVSDAIKESHGISLCAQDCSAFHAGSHTGDISVNMLKEYACEYVIIGHSEKREAYNEGEEILSEKLERASEAGIIPIYCIGEDLDARQEGKVLQKLRQQIRDVGLQRVANSKAIIAYEPIWSIGTGLTPSSSQIEEVARFINDILPGHYVLYGGSVTYENAKEIASISGISGLLIGKSASDIHNFTKIVKAVAGI